MENCYKRIVVDSCKKMAVEELVKGTWGNVSLRKDDKIYITPSGFPYDIMREDDIMVIDLEGTVLEGQHTPSSEWELHVAVYKKREDVEFILHTHPVYSSIASVTMDVVPSLIEDSAMICGSEIKVAEYGDPGSWELANNVVEALGENSAVIMRGHGLVNVGQRFSEAFASAKVTEKNVQIYLEALKLNKKIFTLPEETKKNLREVYKKMYRQ
jgi:L-fuculose-phosphate aldolase